MAVTKRLRFEILRRDDFACRYCGTKAPDVVLTVDHVTPKSLGGTDTADNLVAACQPCNAGKSSATPDQTQVAQVADDALRWAQAIKQAGEEMRRREDERENLTLRFGDCWRQWLKIAYKRFHEDQFEPEKYEKWYDEGTNFVPLDPNWETSVVQWVERGLPMPVLIGLLHKCMSNPQIQNRAVWKYLCGCAWREIGDLEARAAQIVRAEGEQ